MGIFSWVSDLTKRVGDAVIQVTTEVARNILGPVICAFGSLIPDKSAGDNEDMNLRAYVAKAECYVVDDKEKKELEAKIKASKELQRKRAELRRKLGIDNVRNYNYAFSGHTGVGKSSLLNGLLALSGKGAAKTGNVECTMDMTAYHNPKLPKLIYWDLPGGGTPRHPAETYYEDKALHAFDAIVIVAGNRILDLEIKIAKEAKENGKTVVFVRTRADEHITNMVKQKLRNDEEISMAEAAAIFRKEVMADFESQMKAAGLSDIKLLLVCNTGFQPSRVPPYKYENDTSLTCMDEYLLMAFLLESAATRFNDPNVMENLFKTYQARAMSEVSMGTSMYPSGGSLRPSPTPDY